MQAVILAGGKGTRLRPYTMVLPKPLMPLGDHAILEVIMGQLKGYGFTNIILAINYMGHLFESFFSNGEKFGVSITYSKECHPMGTAGPLSLIMDQLEDDFLLMNGDILTTLNFAKFLEIHKKADVAASMCVCRREYKVDYGVIETGSENQLLDYIEKPTHSYLVSMGVNAFKRDLVRDVVKQNSGFLDVPHLMLKLRNMNRVV